MHVLLHLSDIHCKNRIIKCKNANYNIIGHTRLNIYTLVIQSIIMSTYLILEGLET